MRVTNSLFYATTIQNQQDSLKKLYDLNKQESSGMKIQNSFEDSGVYVDTMRLNYEAATLEQVKETSSKALTFAKNTDSTFNQFTDALVKFKTKLIQASGGASSTTSLGALADELEAIKNNLMSLGNTSLNGEFLFSGSSLLQKPIQSDGTYSGNGDSLNALIGSGVELPYNIDGKSLFLGKDSDYNKIVSTNVPMYNQSKLNPSVMVFPSSNAASTKVYLKDSDTIRDMVGDKNNNATDDSNAVFYVSGRKSNGETFSTVLEKSASAKVSDLLDGIGSAYGNTAANKVVDVSLNAHGQIEVKDLKSGSQMLEMNLFGAVDRNALAGQAGDAKEIMNIDNLLINPNVDIIAFNKSNFATSDSSPDLTMRSIPTSTAGQLAIGFPIKNAATTNITTTTLLSGLMPADVNHLDFGATSFNISGKTVQDLMTAIETEYGLGVGGATLSNGQIVTNNSTITLVPKNASNALAHGDALPDAINYARRGFEKDGNKLTSNISQVVKSTNDFATLSTKLVDVAGVSSLNGKQLVLNFTDKNGIERTGTLNLDIADTTFSIDLDNDGNTTDDNETFSIYSPNGDPKNLTTSANKVTYQQLGDVISMVTSGNFPKKGVSAVAQTAINNAIIAGTAPVNAVNLAAETATAKIGVSSKTADYIQKAIDFGIAEKTANALPDPAAEAAAKTAKEKAIASANLEEYNNALTSAKNNVDVSLDYKGRLSITDKSTSQSKIEFTMYDKSATDFTGIGNVALSFMANDSVAISNPSIDFFKDLDAMIEAVRTGNMRMDGASDDPRNLGIQNSLSQLDHLADHVNKAQTKIGASSNALSSASVRAEYLSLNVKTVLTDVIGVDVAETQLKFTQLTIAYQAMLSTISKINSMSLLNYM